MIFSQEPRDVQINQSFTWSLDLKNEGDIDFSIVRINLEDPVSGLKGCKLSAGLRIEPCFESKVKAYESSIFTLDYSTDFQVGEVHATLVIESLYLIQRFPVQIEITAGAIELAYE